MMTYGEDGIFDAAYTYGLERIEVEALDETRPEAQDPLYYLYDGLGSVTFMVKPDGNMRDHYRYDEFGKPAPGNSKLSSDGVNVNHNSFGYTGEMWDEESELLYLRARYYEPETGRFLSRDTYEGELVNPLSKHLYAYVGNNPINFIDPTGHKKNIDDLYPIAGDAIAMSTIISAESEWHYARTTKDKMAAEAKADKARAESLARAGIYINSSHYNYSTESLQALIKKGGESKPVKSGSGSQGNNISNKDTNHYPDKGTRENTSYKPPQNQPSKPSGTPIFSQNGNINTFACHASATNGAPMNQVYVREPDYYAVSYTHGPSTNTYIRDKYGNMYFYKGVTNPSLGGSLRAGYLNRDVVTEHDLQKFLTGYGGTASGGYVVGGGIVYSKGNGTATEIAITTPDASASAGHSWMIYDRKQ